jgi:TP901 family phage tail tape measure protein
MGNGLGKVSQSLANWGVPFTGSLDKVARSLHDSSTGVSGLSRSVETAAAVVTGAGVLGFAAFSGAAVHAADTMQSADASIAASSGTSVKAATAIGNAFLATSGQTMASGSEMATAYAKVAGQLETVEGHALTTSQAQQVMMASADLADNKMGDLGQTTTALAGVMQAYHLKASQAAAVSDTLFTATSDTGNSIQSMTQMLQRMTAQLGTAAPTIQQTSAFMVDLAQHHESGRQALSAVNQAMNTLLGSATKEGQALQLANGYVKQLPPSLQQLAQGYLQGSVTAAELTGKTGGLTAAQQTAIESFKNLSPLSQQIAEGYATGSITAKAYSSDTKNIGADQKKIVTQFESLSPALQQLAEGYASGSVSAASLSKTTAQLTPAQAAALKGFQSSANAATAADAKYKALGLTVLDSQGKFVGLSSIITQLHDKTAGMTQANALAYTSNVLGTASARKLLDVIESGPKVYNADVAAVSKSGVAHKRAEEQMKTLGGQFHLIAAEVDNFAVKWGQILIPIIEKGMKVFGDVIGYLTRHKGAMQALAIIAGGIFAIAVGVTAVAAVAKLGDMIEGSLSHLGNFGSKLTDLVPGLNQVNDAQNVTSGSFAKTGTAAEEAQGAVTRAETGVTSTVEEATTTVQTSCDTMVASFNSVGTAATENEAVVARATAGIEASLATSEATSAVAGGAGVVEGAAGAATGAAGAGAGLAEGAGAAALASTSSIIAATVITAIPLVLGVLGLLHSQKYPKGSFTPTQEKTYNKAHPGSGVGMGGLVAPSIIQPETAAQKAGQAGFVFGGNPNTGLGSLASPQTRALAVAGNNLQIAADKQMLWVAAAQAASDQQKGVSSKTAVAAEKTLQANITSLEGANQVLSGANQTTAAAGQTKTAAATHQKASTLHVTAAGLHAKAAYSAAGAAEKTKEASSDMKKAATALVDGQTKTATMWETKAGKLDTAASNLLTAAEMWSAVYLQFRGPAGKGQFTGMNPPKHAAGGVTTGRSFGEIGESGTEAILPLSSPTAMHMIAEAITGAAGPGLAGSQQTVYAIDKLIIVANNPAEMEQQLTQKARVSALSSKPSGSTNLGVAT